MIPSQPDGAAAAAAAVAHHRVIGVDEAFALVEKQVRRLVTRAPGRTATYTEHGRWVLDRDGWAPSWAGGFLAGIMWILARRTGQDWWRDQAERYTRALEPRKLDTGTHDIGFLLEPSFGRWLDVDPSDRLRDVLITGGRTMAGRFQRAGGYLCTWVDPGSTFVDVMMNVGIVSHAGKLSGDEALTAIGVAHCRTTRRHLVRGDGSTAHEGWFDTTTGEFLRTATHQGWRADSSWARGQAWAVYGFSDAFGQLRDPAMLSTARAVADYYIEQTGPGGVPPNDWLDPAPALPYESSAATIAAAGMFHLADRLAETGETAAERYRSYAETIIARLLTTEFIAVDDPHWEGVVKHATYHAGNGLGVDESVMWGDYYFVEALDVMSRTYARPRR